MSQRSVLVTGATGKQGGAVADHLLSGAYGEFDVYALTRSPEDELGEDQALMFEWINDHGYEADIEALRGKYDFDPTDFLTHIAKNNWTDSTIQ